MLPKLFGQRWVVIPQIKRKRWLNPIISVDAPNEDTPSRSRVVDLDIDIGADAVDYKYVFQHDCIAANA